MKRLYFARSRWCCDEPFYETRTDVWVYGDIPGFEYFASCINEAITGDSVVDMIEIPRRGNSMRAVILPPREKPRVRPRVRFYERCIFPSGRKNMELIVVGNKPGYQRLAKVLQEMINDTNGDPADHFHADDTLTNWVATGSVSLNIRDPLITWNKKNLEHYHEHVYRKDELSFPGDMFWLDEPYDPPDPRDFPL